MIINKTQIELKRGGYALILTGVIAPDISEEIETIWFPLNNLSFDEWISFKFIWYLTITKYRLSSKTKL